MKARRLTIGQEMASAHIRVRLLEQRLTSYGRTYLDNLSHSAALTQKAYAAGEITIFEFGIALDRLMQTSLVWTRLGLKRHGNRQQTEYDMKDQSA